MTETSHDNGLDRRLPIVSLSAISFAVIGFALMVYYYAVVRSDDQGLWQASTLFFVFAVLTGLAGVVMSVKSRDRSLNRSHAGLIFALLACVLHFFLAGLGYAFYGNDLFLTLCALGCPLSLILIVIILFFPVIPRPLPFLLLIGKLAAGFLGILFLFSVLSWFASQLSQEEQQAPGK